MVLLSDGEDEGSETSAKSARKQLAASGVVLDAVSAGQGSQQKELAAFAKAGNGSLVTATDADRPHRRLRVGGAERRHPVGRRRRRSPRESRPGPPSSRSSPSSATRRSPTPRPRSSRRRWSPRPPHRRPGPIAVPPSEPGLFDQPFFLLAVIAAIFLALAAITSLAVGAIDSKNRKEGRVSRRLEEVSVMGPPVGQVAPGQPETVLGESAVVRRTVSFADRVAASRDTTAPGQEARGGQRLAAARRVGGRARAHRGPRSPADDAPHGLQPPARRSSPSRSGCSFPGSTSATARASGARSSTQPCPTPCRCWPAASRPATRCRRPWTTSPRSRAAPSARRSTGRCSRAGLGFPSRRRSRPSPSGCRARTSTGSSWRSGSTGRVGGNLAEVLTNVGKTLRERERLRRQVKTLSAEGVLSAWILGAPALPHRALHRVAEPRVPRAAVHHRHRVDHDRRRRWSSTSSASSGCATSCKMEV